MHIMLPITMQKTDMIIIMEKTSTLTIIMEKTAMNTIITMRKMNITMIITDMIMDQTAPAAVMIMTTIMQTRYSPAGAWRM